MSELDKVEQAMGSVETPNIDTIRGDVGLHFHDFYRCYKCGRMITREEERELFRAGEEGIIEENKMVICKCRSAKYTPAVPADEEWQKPNVLRYTVKMILARVVAPWLEENEPEGLPHLEWLIGSKLLEEKVEVAWPLVEHVVQNMEQHTLERPKREAENG
jgi:hypothetical protein